MLTLNRFHILFQGFRCYLGISICFLAKLFQGFEQQHLLFMFKVSNGNLQITEDKLSENETLAQVFSCKFCEIFKNTFFTEHFQVTASDIRMQVAVIYNLNLSLQFCNDKLYILLCVFTLAYASISLEFLHRFIFCGWVILGMTARQLLKKNNKA